MKPRACNKLKRKNIKTLEEVFSLVDRLVDHHEERVEDKKKKYDSPKEKT